LFTNKGNIFLMDSFANKILALKSEAEHSLSHKDYMHLYKVIWLNRLLLLLGFGTAWMMINPFSMLCISIALHAQWTIVAHHVCHKGYDKVPGTPSRYLSKNFAVGWRRFIDWPDWLYPPAWKYEHNILHHFYTNEKLDPDFAPLVIKGHVNLPFWLRAGITCFYVLTWKLSYYSKNTFKAYFEKKNYDHSTPMSAYTKQAFIYSYLPYITTQLLIVPLLFFPLGKLAMIYVFVNRLGAEILSNIHSFLTIVPNHTGSDIPMQRNHFTNREEFFTRQLESTCNYKTGGFWRDYLQGYLNYQIEHHLFPELPPSQYVKLQPRVKALCEQYGIPYKQESIFIRIRKTFLILLPRKKSAAIEQQ